MTDNGQAIVKTFRQMGEIYKQISLLLQMADSLMSKKRWECDKDYVFYGFSYKLVRYDGWFARIIQRRYVNEESEGSRKYIAVILDGNDSDNFEPVVIGTTLIGREHSLESYSWDSYWWWEKEGDGIIKEPTKIYSAEKRELDHIHLISRPLVSITDTEKLQEYIVTPLLEYTGSNSPE